MLVAIILVHLLNIYCCSKTAVCYGDFSVPELVRSQSTFSTEEVLQNCAGFTLYSSAGLAVGEARGKFQGRISDMH